MSEIARVVSAWSARSTWMWSSGPASHGQSSGNGCREPVMPELETPGGNPPAAPAGRPRYFADDVFGGDQRDRLLERKTALQRLRLLAGPGADLGLFGPGREIGIGLGIGHRRHVAADAHLPS